MNQGSSIPEPMDEPTSSESSDSINTTPPADTETLETPARRALRVSNYSDSEMRMLYITVIGTVIGALLTVIILGVALILAHSYRQISYGTGFLGWFILASNLMLLTSAPWVAKLERSNPRKGITYAYGRGLFYVSIFFGMLSLLVWVGLASGVANSH
jgi:hypothetical protein